MSRNAPPLRTIAWLRGDLRVDDNPTLAAAMDRGCGGVLPIFIATPAVWERHHLGPPKLAMIAGGVMSMADRLAPLGLDLKVFECPTADPADLASLIVRIARHHDVSEIHASREFGIDEERRDEIVTEALEREGRDLVLHEDQTILPVREIRSGSGTPYTVFTPFRRKWTTLLLESGIPEPVVAPESAQGIDAPTDVLPEEIGASELARRHPAGSFPPGEEEPTRRLTRFLDGPIDHYHERRDPPALDGTSALSPWLACGSLSPRRALAALVERFGADPGSWAEGPATWLSELVWRDFYRHAMDGIPRLSMDRPLHGWTDRVVWRNDPDDFEAWRQGRTGIAIVDAGMRQLAETGWMHNRVRMIVATFLSKHLLIDWRWGERHFMRSLADADFPSNNGGWQWAASTGTDAAPYFRVFNPDTQRDRFDPRSEYVRRWAPDHVEGAAPPPLVELKAARLRAIDAFKTAKNAV